MDGVWTSSWTKEAHWERSRKCTAICILARPENEGWLQPPKQLIRPAALARQRTSREPEEQLLILHTPPLLPARCPALWAQRFKPLSEFPTIGLGTSRGRQVGRVGHPAAGTAQLLMKGNAFTWRNVNLQSPPCSVLSNKPCTARRYTQVVYRKADMQHQSHFHW